jgi:cell division initiation protein
MALTPVEIRHLAPERVLFRGYDTETTDKLLEEIATSFEDVWRERADLADKVEQLETDLIRFRELETLLRATLVSAEQASVQTREQARREAELILGEAHAEARKIQRQAFAENERLDRASRRLRSQLQEALSVFAEPEADGTTAATQNGGDPEAKTGEERSWYGEPDANAALGTTAGAAPRT